MRLSWICSFLMALAFFAPGVMAVPRYSDYSEKQFKSIESNPDKSTVFSIAQSALQQIHPQATQVKWFRVDLPGTSYFVYKAHFIQGPETVDFTVEIESYADGLEWNYRLDSVYRLRDSQVAPIEIVIWPEARKKMDAFLKKHSTDDIFRLEHRHALSQQQTTGAKLYGLKLFSGYGVYNGTTTTWFGLNGQAVSKAPFKH